MIDLPALGTQQSCNPLVSIAAILSGQLDNISGEGFFIIEPPPINESKFEDNLDKIETVYRRNITRSFLYCYITPEILSIAETRAFLIAVSEKEWPDASIIWRSECGNNKARS